MPEQNAPKITLSRLCYFLTKSSRSRDRITLPRKFRLTYIIHPRVLKHFGPEEGDWGNESLITPKFHIPSIYFLFPSNPDKTF